MAQVRKYATGGGAKKKTENPPTLFHWDGIGDYNVADLEKTYATNIDDVLSQYDLPEEDKRKIRDRAYLTLQEIKSGRMGNRNANGTWVNVTPGFESTGMNEKERKWFLGRKKYVKDADFYQNLAYDVLDQMIGKTNTYTAPKDPAVTPAKVTDFNFGNYLTDYYFYNKQFDPNNWDFANAKTNIGSRLAEFKKKVIDSDLPDKDKNDLLGRIGQVESAFQTEDVNDDYYGLVRLMNDPRRWFDKYYVTNDPSQKPLTEEERKTQEDKQRFDEAYKARLASDNDYWTSNYRSWKYDPSIKLINPDRYNVNQLQDLINWNSLSEGNVTNPIISYFNQYISDKDVQEELNRLGYYEDGWYYLPVSSDLRTNMITRVNPSTNTLERVPLTSFKLGQEDYTKRIQLELAKELGIVGPWTTSIPSNKEGGIIKAQEGRAINAPIRVNKNKRESSNINTSTQKAESKSNDEGTTLDWSNLSAADKSRLASIGLDLISGGSSFVPVYGTAVSAVTGLGSTAANAYADYEKYGLGTAALNLIPNLALDVVGLIPGGGIVAKGAKAVRAIKKSAALATLVGTAMSLNGVADSWNRIKEGNGTVEDYQALTSTISGLARIPGGQFVKGRAVKKGLLKEVHPLDIEGKKYNLDEDTYKAVLKASSKEAQENILKQAGFDIKLNDKITSKLGKRIRNYWNPGNPEYILTDKGRNASWAYRPGLNLNLSKENRNYNSIKPEANVGDNRVVNEVNQATKNWWKEHEKDVRGATNDIAEAMRRADEYNKRFGRLALPPKSQGAEIPSNSKKAFTMPESIPVSKPAQKDFNKGVNKFYKDIGETVLPTPKIKGIEIEYIPPTVKTAPTISWENASKNYEAIKKLKEDRALNELTTKNKNLGNKLLNQDIDSENKARRAERIERGRRDYVETIKDLLKKQQVKNYSPTLPNRSANQVGSEDFGYYGYLKDMAAKSQKELAKRRSKLTGQENQKRNAEKKKSNNEKETSKESKGYVNKKAEGGIIKAQQGTTLRDVASTANWAKQIYGTDAYFNWLKSFNINNYQNFNNYQKGWNTNYLASNYNPTGTNKTGNIAYSQNVWDSQGIFNKQANGVNQIIENLANTGVITRRGNSGDNATRNFQDGYFGGQEYLRHGGMESMLTPEQVAEINKNVNPQGLEYYFDPTTKMGFLRPLQQATKSASFDPLAGLPQSEKEIPELQGTTSQQIINELTGTNRTGEPGRLDINKSTGIKPQINWGDILGTARLAGTIWTNNRIAKDIKNSLSPLLIDPPQIRRSVVGDLATRNYMEKLGAEANRIGSRPITSDASLQLGQALDYNNRANEYRIKGYLADKEAINKTSLAAQEAAEQNAITRVDAANRNRASMLGIRQAKANVEAQRKSANWSQAVAPWLMDKEFRMRQNQKILNSLNYEGQDFLDRQALETASDQAQAKLNQAKQQFLNSGGTEETWVGSPQYNAAMKTYNQDQKNAANTYLKSRLDNQRAIYSSPWIMFKSGGKLSYEERAALEHNKAINKSLLQDSKEFNKIIRESKKENNKLILSLSGLSKELVIKSMTYGG